MTKEKTTQCACGFEDDKVAHTCIGEKINRIMQPIHDMADICEEAHRLTVEECKRQGVIVEVTHTNGDVRYTENAQDIFNVFYEELTDKHNI